MSRDDEHEETGERDERDEDARSEEPRSGEKTPEAAQRKVPRKKVTDKSKMELILLITPRVLFTPSEADAVTRERVKALSSHPYKDAGDATYEDAVRKLEKENAASTKGKGPGEGEEKR